ncbi:TPA: hypothetical protein P0E28_004090 [Vibrio campbellii]|nr:hypothetical protein [Vibrio campbellii]
MEVSMVNLTVDALVLAALSTASWDGVYHCEVGLGQTNSGLNAWVEYQLSIDDESCTLGILGFQTEENIKCATSSQDHTIDILFTSYSNGRVTNRYGVQLYQVGEPLLRLIQREDSVVTEWKAIQPNSDVQQTTYCFDRKEKS